MRFKLLLLLLGSFYLIVDGYAQQKSIKGTVKDDNGQVVIGATVAVRNATISVATNQSGQFTLNVPSLPVVLLVSHVGMESQEVPVRQNKEIHIVLKTVANTLDNVVIVGYGTVKKADLTGAVQSVSNRELNKGIPGNVLEAMQGKLAGVNVTQNDGAPGAGISIRIRGSNSFLGGTEPLYVVDGVAINSSNSESTPQSLGEDEKQTLNALSFLNPNDIESITVLKDASAAAIYGSRGANGVVIITTRQGRLGKDKVELNLSTGFSEVSKRLHPLNAYDYATFQNLANYNANAYTGMNYQIPYPGKYRPDPDNPGDSVYVKGPQDYIGGGIDWQDQVFRKGIFQNYSISLSGGNDLGNHYLSFNYLDQNGAIVNSDYKRYNLNVSLNRNLGKVFKIGTRNTISITNLNGIKTGTDKSDDANAGVIRSLLTFPTTRTNVQPYGTSTGDESFITNPVLYVKDVLNQVKGLNIFSSNFIEAAITSHLKVRQNIGFNYSSGLRNQYYPRTVYEGYSDKGRALKADNSWQSLVSETVLTYEKKSGKNSINIVGGGTYEHTNSEWKRIEVKTFPNDLLKNENMEAGEQRMPIKESRSAFTLISFLGRVNYSYDDRYLATVSFREDGSSKFGEDNKWAGFASAALAWKISNEAFMRNQHAVSDLKLRFSFGQTGNQGIGAYSSLSKLTVYNYPFGGSVQTGLADDVWAGPANPKLRWETTTSYNAGIDAAFLDNRITLTADVYKKRTNDLLQFVTTPSSTGFSRQLRNSGSVENKGLEIVLGGIPVVKKDFSWTSNFNIAFNRNKILSLGADVTEQYAANISTGDAPFIQIPGYAIGTLYGYVEDGYYDNEAEVRSDPAYTNQSNDIILRTIGEIKYKNLDSDPTSISISDKTIIGDVNPDYTFGFVNNFRYKKLDLSIFVNGVQGNDVINMNTRFNANIGTFKNITEKMYAGAWKYGADNAGATYPKIMRQYWRTILFSRRFVEDGSFVRIKNVTVGYTMSSPFKGISSLRIAAGVNNLYTFTRYSGYDPEVNSYGDNPALFGVDLGGYPNVRTYNFSVRCNF